MIIYLLFMMPELSGNYTSFAFLSSCIKRCHFFWFSIFWAAILNLKVKTDPKYNEYHYIRSAKPVLVENDTSEVLIIHLAQEKSLLMFLNMVSKTTTGRPSWI